MRRRRRARGDTRKGNQVRVVTDHDVVARQDAPPSQDMVDPGGQLVERYLPAQDHRV